MSAIDNSEVVAGEMEDEDNLNLAHVVNINNGSSDRRRPKRVIHFSDGILEETDSEEEETNDELRSRNEVDNLTEPLVDPKTLSWPGWIHHHTTRTGVKTLGFMDYMGESLSYYLGITSSKYQYEIDEYHRVKQEEEAKTAKNDAELASWSSPSTSNSRNEFISLDPIVTEVLSSSKTSQITSK